VAGFGVVPLAREADVQAADLVGGDGAVKGGVVEERGRVVNPD